MPRTTPVTANANFWSKVDKTGTCWLWTGVRTKMGGRYGRGGYGQFSNVAAHRVAYIALVGPIPAGMTLDHLCGVTACVNPAHLEPVTGAENTRRYFAALPRCAHGHEFVPENTALRERDGYVTRVCRACDRARHRRARTP